MNGAITLWKSACGRFRSTSRRVSCSVIIQTAIITCLRLRAAIGRGWRCGCRWNRCCGWRAGESLRALRLPYDTTRYYRLRVENDGATIRAFVDDKLILTAQDGELVRGKVGVTANIPARFQDFRVSAPDVTIAKIKERIARREDELAALRAGNPQPKLWKQFATPQFGAGRNMRLGDLDGDGTPEMLIAQNIPRFADNFIQISCLTAVNLDGKVLWQLGRPDPRNGLLTADTPFQIHDLDGDGRNEVVMVKDFKLQVLEGGTGRVQRWVWMPEARPDNGKRPYRARQR